MLGVAFLGDEVGLRPSAADRMALALLETADRSMIECLEQKSENEGGDIAPPVRNDVGRTLRGRCVENARARRAWVSLSKLGPARAREPRGDSDLRA